MITTFLFFHVKTYIDIYKFVTRNTKIIITVIISTIQFSLMTRYNISLNIERKTETDDRPILIHVYFIPLLVNY